MYWKGEGYKRASIGKGKDIKGHVMERGRIKNGKYGKSEGYKRECIGKGKDIKGHGKGKVWERY